MNTTIKSTERLEVAKELIVAAIEKAGRRRLKEIRVEFESIVAEDGDCNLCPTVRVVFQ